MPPFGPISRRKLIAAFRKLGFSGPYSGGNHEFMVKDSLRVRMPNPHGTDVGRGLLKKVLREAGIDRKTWERL